MKKIILLMCFFIGLGGSFEGVQASENKPVEYIAYYGEISKNTGRPKTKYVNGYYRKDGTYVEGYYRS